MKKGIAVLLAMSIIICSVFVACAKNDEDTTGESISSEGGIEDSDSEIGFETMDVTDENGKAVTDADGNKVTTEVAVKYELNKKGKTVAKVLDKDGNVVTDKHGKEVTIDTDETITTTTKKGSGKTEKSTESTTAKTEKSAETTSPELTTKKEIVPVPSTDTEGTKVIFSNEDQQVIKNMLEVPYLYQASYENSQGVPASIATHAAIWMAERSQLSTTTYAAGTVVIDLFKYFGQTVVHFKNNCNNAGNENITYNSSTDTFTISNFEEKTHDVTLTGFESLGGNNYYKVTATVKAKNGASGVPKKVTAIVQKNKLDAGLGFSIKALKWS